MRTWSEGYCVAEPVTASGTIIASGRHTERHDPALPICVSRRGSSFSAPTRERSLSRAIGGELGQTSRWPLEA